MYFGMWLIVDWNWIIDALAGVNKLSTACRSMNEWEMWLFIHAGIEIKPF